MKRIGYVMGIIAVVFVIATSYALKTTFASSFCGTKDAAAAEKADTKCVVCGKVIEKDKGVKVACEGKTVTLCCDGCAEAFKKDPCKYCDQEKCEKRK